eukprot:jgi/Orpsp1_1/1189910/evm.model.d7180000075414.1
MSLEEYPVYNYTLKDIVTPVTYRYILNDKEESFDRILNTGTVTLNEFFDRSITVKYHPSLPKAYDSFPTFKNSKLYDDTHVGTVIVKCNSSKLKKLHANPKDDIKITGVELIYANPYTVKKFSDVKMSASGQS